MSVHHRSRCDDAGPVRAALARHGGDLSAAAVAFPDAPAPWVDLSTGINPWPYPVAALPASAWCRLPEAAGLAALEQVARRHYGAAEAVGVVAAPGTQALIQLLPRALPARCVAILDFGYQEHPAVWRDAGASVTIAASLDGLCDADVAVVTNPNNPDGRRIPPERLRRLAEGLATRGGTLVIDEAFADALGPDSSLVPQMPSRGTLVLRSFGKFFGLAGLRLGFAIGDPALCVTLRTGLGPWAVSGLALAIGARALDDADWQADTRATLRAAADRLDAQLEGAGCTIVGGTPLFRLAAHPAASALFDRLGAAGILVRPFDDHPTWLRFGLPPDEAAWARLARALPP